MSELTPERWREVSALLDRVLRVEPAERQSWLEREVADTRIRAEVAELASSAERAPGVLDGAAGAHMATLLREEGLTKEPSDAPGSRIGPYRIVREIGRGGMGIVYLAMRADGQFENRVALKLVKPGFDGREIVRRFERERRIAARLEHPAIARLFDGGLSDDGRPYFAMEFVDGEPLAEYCDRNVLSIEDRLRLFSRVCEAVQYAHSRLVVHRDLKPSNIMVTADGDLKLVDFGVAKLLFDEGEPLDLTSPGERFPLTPAYAAPEQFSGEPVTAATDVYALGLVLYELLVGQRPFAGSEGNARKLERATLETDPTPPSRIAAKSPLALTHELSETTAGQAAARGVSARSLARRLEGDLDAIVLTALRKEPAARYPSAEALRADIASHLAHRPIQARRETRLARVAKFVRRHRTGVAATTLLALSIAAGFTGTAWQARQKTLEAEKAQQVTDFLTGLFEAADPARAKGKEMTVREVVELGGARIERELAGQPELQAEMELVLGRITHKLGHSEEALAMLDRSLAGSSAGGGPSSRKTHADALRAKGAALVELGRAEEAEPVLRAAIAEREELPARGRNLEIAEDLDELSIALDALGRLEESEAAVYRAFELRLPTLGPDHPGVASSYNNLAVIQRQLGKLDQAEGNYEKALAIRIPALGKEHPETADTLNNLGGLLYYRGRYAEAVVAFEEVYAIYTRLYGAEHPRTVTGANNLAVALLKLGEIARAETLFDSVLVYWRETAGDKHPNALMTLGNLGLLYQIRGEALRAEKTHNFVVENCRSVLGREHPVTAVLTLRLASVFRELGRHSQARDLVGHALGVLEEVYGPEHLHVAAGLEELGRIESELGQAARAEEHLRQAVAIRRAQVGAEAFETLAARTALASVLRDLRDQAESERLLAADLATGREVLPENHPVLIDLLLELGRTLGAANRIAEAEPLLREAQTLAARRYGAESWRTAQVELRLAELLAATGRAQEAGELAAGAYAVFADQLGVDHPLARAARDLRGNASG